MDNYVDRFIHDTDKLAAYGNIGAIFSIPGADAGEVEEYYMRPENAHRPLILSGNAQIFRIEDWVSDVRQFMEMAGQDIPTAPTPFDADTALLRHALIDEEYTEVIHALQAGDLPALAKELVDLIYVSIGTAVAAGIDLRPIWQAIHEANMQKEGGATRWDGKLQKPEGWQPPNIEALLAAQGYEAAPEPAV